MMEMTLGGAWFRWSAFDARSRGLAAASMALAAAAGMLIGMAAKPVNARFGFDVTGHEPALALSGMIAALVSALLWYWFSQRQDEMFNRIQNWALGMAGAWSCVAMAIWSILTTASLTAAMPWAVPALLFGVATVVFWFVAVRKWAS